MAKQKKKALKGEFKFILAVDCETTGLNYNSDNSAEGHQAVSWGIIVADARTFKVIEELYVEIKWNKQSKELRKHDVNFGKGAEKIHGLTYDYLEKNGMEEEDAVVKIGQLVLKYWGPENSPRLLGHNVHRFDYVFLVEMFRRHGIELKKANRHVDTSSIGLITLGAFTSDQLFETLGFEKRKEHNALDDARMSLKSCQIISKLWREKVKLLVQEDTKNDKSK